MQSQDFGQGNFGLGATDTMMHPVVAVVMVVAIALVLRLPRRFAVVPFLLALFLLPVGQQLYIGGVHFYVPRIIILFAVGRLITAKLKTKGNIFAGGFNNLDKIFTAWAIVRGLAVTIYYWGNTSAFTYQVATLWDVLGGFYVLRFFIQDMEDIELVAKCFAIIAGILGLTMLNELVRNQNVFGYLGGVPIVPSFREGKIRAQGPFEHSLLAGSFGATLLPIFLWLWHSKRSKSLGIVGVLGCTAMMFSSSSSTPLLAYLAALLGICFWPLRRHMRAVRWTVVIALIVCHLLMKAPVWFLIAHVDIVAGSGGSHRAELIDSFVKHVSDWWLFGTDKAATWGIEMDDLCEQWVAEGETGGLATLVLFILLVSASFGRIGRALKQTSSNLKQEWFLWLIGAALFSHVVAFFGISYFDQTRFSWFALLVIISVATVPALSGSKVTKRSAKQERLDGKGSKLSSMTAAAFISSQFDLSPLVHPERDLADNLPRHMMTTTQGKYHDEGLE